VVRPWRLLLWILLLASGSTSALAANEKIVYHIHGSDPEIMQRAINNLENLVDGMPDQNLDIRLLLQGDSIQLLNPYMHSRDINQRLQVLQNQGVSVEVNRDNYHVNAQFLESSPSPLLVKNIFSRIIDLQKQGYHYITP